MHPDFQFQRGESWRDIREKCVKSRPSWGNGKVMCARWHTKGDCYSDCRNKESHVGKDKVPDDKVIEYKEYLAKVCSQN